MVHTTIEKETQVLNTLKGICDEIGIKYSENLCISSSYNMANDVLLDDILTFQENKEILDKIGIKDRSTFYRKHFCEPKSPFYINKTEGKFDVFYVAKVIHDAGGKVFFAHPFVYKLPNLEEILDELVSLGIIDGIECQHRKHTEEQIR